MLVSLPYWLLQMARHGKYREGLAERLGRVPSRLGSPSEQEPVIWVHAVSVGEVLAVAGLVEELRQRSPRHRIFVSTTTDTGQTLARKRFGEENVFYFPMDFAFAIRPYLRELQPELLVLAETEFWPNFLRLTNASGARIAVVNARISDRSWPNYRRFRCALRKMLAHIDLFFGADTRRMRETAGSSAPKRGTRARSREILKFDMTAPSPAPIVEACRQSLAERSAGPGAGVWQHRGRRRAAAAEGV